MQNFPQSPEILPASGALFFAALEKFGETHLAHALGLHQNTLRRWQETDSVPPSYRGDIARILGHKGQATGVDQFYTKPQVAAECWAKFLTVCESLDIDTADYHFIEPAAGCGRFYDQMPAARRTGLDIQPDGGRRKLHQADFLTWQPPRARTKKYAVVGNPPFGLRGHLALLFINHAATFADVVAFILPQLFDSDGKGVPAKRVKGLKLAHSEKLPANSFQTPNGEEIPIHTVFQVWTKINTERISIPPRPTCADYIRVYSLSDGGTPASTRNRKMLYSCDVYLPSTCFSQMRPYKNFEDLPHRRGYGVVIHKCKREIKRLLMHNDWNKTAFSSTNSALNLRRSLIEDVVASGGYKNK